MITGDLTAAPDAPTRPDATPATALNPTATPPAPALDRGCLPFDGRPPTAADTRARAMARFEDDEAFFERIVPLFRQAALEQAYELEQALQQGDAARIQHWAHTLKGSLLTVGANPPADHAEWIEQRAAQRRLDGLAQAVGRLVAETNVIVDQLAATAPATGA